MSFVEIAQTDQIAPGTMKTFMVADKKIMVCNVEGKYYAVGGTCGNPECEIAQGMLKDNIARCPKHWFPFDVTTGKALFYQYSFMHFQPEGMDLPCYKLKIEGKSLQVDI